MSITCHIVYRIDPAQVPAFETYARVWITLVNRLGGTHHGYLLPSEGANDVAIASFSFPSLADYEAYRTKSFADADCLEAFGFAESTGCIRSYERSFFRPVMNGVDPSELPAVLPVTAVSAGEIPA